MKSSLTVSAVPRGSSEQGQCLGAALGNSIRLSCRGLWCSGQAVPVLSGFAFAIYTDCISAALLRGPAAASACQEGWVGQCAPSAPSLDIIERQHGP